MRTLLRHTVTGQYYQSSGKWTNDPRRAREFAAISQVVSAARKTHCPNLEVDIAFDTPQQAAAFRLIQLFERR